MKRDLLNANEALRHEISERKRVEAALRASEIKYRRLHESMADAFVAVDMTGRIQECNRAYQALLGYSEEELRSLTYVDLTPEKWHCMEARLVAEQILPRGHSDVYEKEYRRKDGTILPVEMRTFLIRDVAGNPTGMWAIARDITARKRAEDIAAAANRRLAADLDVMSRLQGIAADFVSERSMEALFDEIVDTAVAITAADMGDMQLLDPHTGKTRIAAHRGFGGHGPDFRLAIGDGGYDATLMHDQRTVIEDVTKSPLLASSLVRDIHLAADVRALISIPILSRSGNLLGGISAYFKTPCHPDDRTLKYLDLLAQQTADIIDYSTMQETLLQSEERFHKAIADAPFPALIHAEDGEIVLVNSAWTDITGYKHQDIPTIAEWTERAYGVRKDVVQEGIARLYQLQGRLAEGEYVIATRSGQTRIWEFSSSPIGRLPDGRRLVLSMAMDVTNRKQAEESVARIADELAKVYDSAPVMMVLLDEDRRIHRANRTAQQTCAMDVDTTGLRAGAALRCVHAMDVAEGCGASPDCQACRIRILVSDTLRNGSSYHQEKCCLVVDRDDGRTSIFLLVSCVRLTLEGKPYALLMVEDITKHEQTERQLRERETELAHVSRLHVVDAMSASLAHELNQPLYAINNYVRGIRRRLQKNRDWLDLDQLTETMEMVSKEVTRAAGIVAHLREFVKTGDSRRSKVHVGPMLHQALELLQSLADAKGVLLEVAVQQNLPIIQADPIQIEQVVVNLVANAVDATAGLPAERRKVKIFAGQSDNAAVEIEVRDLGRGYPESMKDRLFDAFITTKKNGLGVGLAISKAIVESHGGKIRAVRNSPYGTSVYFTVPSGFADEESDRDK